MTILNASQLQSFSQFSTPSHTGVIRQNGCPNCIKFSMTLKPKQKSRFITTNKGDAPWAMTHPLKPEHFVNGKTITAAH
ncbi:hypothetical protein [Bradyrhizobium erythrophlei]|uniref:hypothetical protein n=1 Tax=Bradyrhizobium erythrophlei TaxID=1437360 RepID=UPI0012ABA477|nr:hypothetical protein [Bradyrhizobium erythrophlei]